MQPLRAIFHKPYTLALALALALLLTLTLALVHQPAQP